MRTLALLWHSETHVVTAWGMPGNSFKGMLIFQMLLDINKPPNWRAEIRFERSSAWRYRDVYPSLPICVAGRLSGHLVFTFDKGFLSDYQFSCSQQRGHSGEGGSYKNLIVSCLGDTSSTLQKGRTGREDNLCGSFCCATRLQTKSVVRCDQIQIQQLCSSNCAIKAVIWKIVSRGQSCVENIEHEQHFCAVLCRRWRWHWCHHINSADVRHSWTTTEDSCRQLAAYTPHANSTNINMLAVAKNFFSRYFCKCSLKTRSSRYHHPGLLLLDGCDRFKETRTTSSAAQVFPTKTESRKSSICRGFLWL